MSVTSTLLAHVSYKYLASTCQLQAPVKYTLTTSSIQSPSRKKAGDSPANSWSRLNDTTTLESYSADRVEIFGITNLNLKSK